MCVRVCVCGFLLRRKGKTPAIPSCLWLLHFSGRRLWHTSRSSARSPASRRQAQRDGHASGGRSRRQAQRDGDASGFVVAVRRRTSALWVADPPTRILLCLGDLRRALRCRVRGRRCRLSHLNHFEKIGVRELSRAQTEALALTLRILQVGGHPLSLRFQVLLFFLQALDVLEEVCAGCRGGDRGPSGGARGAAGRASRWAIATAGRRRPGRAESRLGRGVCGSTGGGVGGHGAPAAAAVSSPWGRAAELRRRPHQGRSGCTGLGVFGTPASGCPLLPERPGRRHRWESCLLWEILPAALNGKAALARRAEGSQSRASLPFGRRRSSVSKRARRPGRPVSTSAGARCLPRWRPRMNERGPAQSTFRPPGSRSLHPLFQAPLKQSKGMCVARLQRPGHSRRHQGVEEIQPSGRTQHWPRHVCPEGIRAQDAFPRRKQCSERAVQ